MRSISGRTAGTDPDYAPVVEVFDNLSHTQIYEAVRQLDPAALTSAGEVFLTTATGLGTEVENAHAEISAAIADGWRGGAAQSAADAITAFEQAGRRIADVLTAVGVRLGQAGDAAESVRAAVAEPSTVRPDSAAALLDNERATDNADITRRAEDARLDAVRAMETIYAGAFVPTGTGVPAFPDPVAEPGAVPAAAAPKAGAPSAAEFTVAAPGVGAPATADAPAEAPGVVAVGDADPATAPSTIPAIDGTLSATTTSAAAFIPSATAPAAVAAPGQIVPSAPGTVPAAVGGSAGASALVGYASVDPSVGRPARTTRPGSADTRAGGPGTTTDDFVSATDADPITAAAPDGPIKPAHTGDPTIPANSGHPVTAAGAGVPTMPANSGHPVAPANTGDPTSAASADGRHDAAAASADATAGMSAGAIGGLMGGAMVAADTTRPSGGPRPQPRQDDYEDEDDDEFLRFLDEEPTYLEPADEVNALIGKMEPTSPAVLGEWTERG
ncbi:WXG100 family type VII secretion target [Nocardia asteroides]|uniref:WXG100 family type VII secretion target n=1 Tax=Nocardia asteroides TaxID=1824 RepID=UPI0033E4B1DE